MKLVLVSTLALAVLICLSGFGNSHAVCFRSNGIYDRLVHEGKLKGNFFPMSTSSNTCGGLWIKEMTCCDQASATQWVQNDGSTIDSLISKFTTAYSELKRVVESMISKGKSDKKSPLNFLSNLDLTFLQNLLKDTQIKKMQDSLNKCWGKMKQMRAASMCYACSGHSSKYFYNYHRLAVSLEQCEDIAKECKVYFSDTISLIAGVADFLEDIRSYLDVKNLQNDSFKWMIELEVILNNEDLVDILKALDSTKGNERKAASYHLCNKQLKLTKKPFLEDMVALVQALSKNLDSILLSSQTYELQVKSSNTKPTNQKKWKPRFLEGLNDPSFSASSLVSPPDAVIVAHTNLGDNTVIPIQNQQTANVTMAFF